MRKNVGIVLIGLSGFLLFAGLLAVTWAPGKSEKTPLDVDSTTVLSGQAAKLDTSTNELVSNPVIATSITKTDSNASDDDVAVWVSTSCVVIDENDPPPCVESSDPRLITASIDIFATDRVTALTVNDEKYVPADEVQGEGLRNKWPFSAEKKSYPYWDGVLGAAVQAEFDRTEKVEGLDTYVYKVTITDADIEIAEGVPGTYDDVKEIFVEPKTGVHRQPDRRPAALPRRRHHRARPAARLHRRADHHERRQHRGQPRVAQPDHAHRAADRLHRRVARAHRRAVPGHRRHPQAAAPDARRPARARRRRLSPPRRLPLGG